MSGPMCVSLHSGMTMTRGIRGIFSEGQSNFSDFFPNMKCFFPVENSILVDPKQASVVLKNESKKKKKKRKKKKKKKKKKGPLLIWNFSSFHFQFSTSPFSISHLFFSIFPLFLASLFLVGQQTFPGEKCQALPPCPYRLLQ